VGGLNDFDAILLQKSALFMKKSKSHFGFVFRLLVLMSKKY